METISIAMEGIRLAMIQAQANGDEVMVRQLLKAAKELIVAKQMINARTQENVQ
jgi:hypothetical protein